MKINHQDTNRDLMVLLDDLTDGYDSNNFSLPVLAGALTWEKGQQLVCWFRLSFALGSRMVSEHCIRPVERHSWHFLSCSLLRSFWMLLGFGILKTPTTKPAKWSSVWLFAVFRDAWTKSRAIILVQQGGHSPLRQKTCMFHHFSS